MFPTLYLANMICCVLFAYWICRTNICFPIFDKFNKCPLLLAPSTWILCQYSRLILTRLRFSKRKIRICLTMRWTASPGGIFHRTVFIFSLENINFINEKVRFQTAVWGSRHYSSPPSSYDYVLNNGNYGRSKSLLFTKFGLHPARFLLPL